MSATVYGVVAEYKIMRIRETPLADCLLDNPEKVHAFWRDHIATRDWYDTEKECFCVMFVNTRRRVTGFNLVSIGTLDTIITHPREVFRPAIVQNASAIVIGHSHPSGDPTPSEADIKITRDLIRAGQLLKVDLLDHVVMGAATPERPKPYVSLRESGYFYA
jgi:DNA repair protein RadC